jgi:hypothetical protein
VTTTALDYVLSRSGLAPSDATSVRQSTEELQAKLLAAGAANNTALVVGRVQSGKTLSFTCLIARAADSGTRLVVVLAGTKDILAKQTFRRLRKALDERRFVITYNPPGVPDMVFRPSSGSTLFSQRTHVIVLLKNAARIKAVVKSLVQQRPDALGRVLVIDDEADAAGLNTRLRQGDSSPTYRAIGQLRRHLGSHSYVQYTATPQANLFIPLVDHLSPDCVHLLEPGPGYVGGESLFETEGVARHIRSSDADEARRGSCPAGLATALVQYLVGFTSWAKRGFPGFDVRSMLVHPSQFIDSHEQHRRFIEAKLGHWETLAMSGLAEDRVAVLSEMRAGCDDLLRTFPDLGISAEEVVDNLSAIRQEVAVRSVNSDSDIDIDWSASRGWILVGGANLDRGFTIPGLAVTYMPRPEGQGNIDTLQQRGRFFGYVSNLLPECRVHLDPAVLDRYRDIARHERDVHRWLSDAVRSNRNVREIRRRFVMSQFLQPTRRDVIDPSVAIGSPPEWFEQSSAPRHLAIAKRNLPLIRGWLESRGHQPRELNSQADSPFQRHVGHLGIPLKGFTELLSGLAVGDPDESRKWCIALASLEAAAARNASLKASVVFMRPGARPRRDVSGGMLRDLLQGRGDGGTYQGDRHYADGDAALQIHVVDLVEPKEDGEASLVHEQIPVLALRVAPHLLQRVVMLDA